MRQFYFCFTILLLLFSSLSCDKEELKATIPAYLTIEEIGVTTDRQELGSSSANIQDAWVFIDDRLIGSFQLPATIPILNTGEVNLKVRGGILNNGQSTDRVIYDFYDFYDTTMVFEKEIEYQPIIKVPYKVETVTNDDWSGEDFETGVNFINNPNSDVSLKRETESSKVFEGDASGSAKLGIGKVFFETYSRDISSVSRSGLPVYLEFDYKSTHDFQISIYANNRTSQFPVLTIRARNEWNKIYVDFSKVFSTLFNANNFNIAFGYTKPSSEEGELLIDNVKLLEF